MTISNGPIGYFKYKVNEKTYEFWELGDFSYLDIGDSTQIEYSISDNNIAKVIRYGR